MPSGFSLRKRFHAHCSLTIVSLNWGVPPTSSSHILKVKIERNIILFQEIEMPEKAITSFDKTIFLESSEDTHVSRFKFSFNFVIKLSIASRNYTARFVCFIFSSIFFCEVIINTDNWDYVSSRRGFFIQPLLVLPPSLKRNLSFPQYQD